MDEANKLYEVWVYLQAEPLLWLTLTIGIYLFAMRLYESSGLFPLINPVAISIILVSSCLLILNVEYERYFDGAKFIHFLLGPTTVALAVPIFLNWDTILRYKKAIVISVFAGTLFAISMTFLLAHGLKLDPLTTKSLLPRSVTAPIAMGISELIGGIPSLTAIITRLTGIIGAALGAFVLDLFKIKDMAARGFAFGLASHGIGTARAMSKNKKAGVFAAVAMGLSGIITALLIPVIFLVIKDLIWPS